MLFLLGIVIGAILGSPACRAWIGIWAKELAAAIRARMGSK
jgi:hypothetical protein